MPRRDGSVKQHWDERYREGDMKEGGMQRETDRKGGDRVRKEEMDRPRILD